MNDAVVASVIREYYGLDGNECGGNLHLSLDDGNLDDASIEADIERARGAKDREGVAVGELLLTLPEEHRVRMKQAGWQSVPEADVWEKFAGIFDEDDGG